MDTEQSKKLTLLSRLDVLTEWSIYATAFLLPLLILPFGGSELFRVTVFSVLIFLAFGSQLVKGLRTGSISYTKSPLNVAVSVFVAVSAFSTFFSGASSAAFGSSDVISERFLSIIVYALLYVLAISALRSKDTPIIFMLSMITGGTLAGIVSFAQYFGLYLPFDFTHRIDFNAIGTLNGLALYYGFLFAVVVGILLRVLKQPGVRTLKIGLWVAFVILLLNLIVINFLNAWILLLASIIFIAWFFMIGLEKERGRQAATESLLREPSFFILAALFVIPLAFIFIRVPLFSSISIPLEVSPSFSATWDIAIKVLKPGVVQGLFGIGPGTFSYSYGTFHDSLINLTNFWTIRFGQGYSFLLTALSTTGGVGFLAILGIVVAGVFSVGRALLASYPRHPFAGGIIGGSIFLVLAWFVYPANFALMLSAFILLGLAVGVTAPEKETFLWGVRDVHWKTPWSVFLSSLGIIFLLGATFGGIAYEVQRYRAALTSEHALTLIQQKGDLDGGIERLTKAASLDSKNDQYHRFIAQARFLKIQNIISAALGSAPSSSIQADFQREVSASIAALQQAIQLNPLESINFRTAGSIYETLIPFVPGADQSAVNSYTRAAQLEPVNPLIFAEIARVYVTIADTAQNLANQPQASSDQSKMYNEMHARSLESATATLKRTIELKGDFATGHFLLAQVALRQGKTDEAIKNTENARRAAPQDIGILFQLGLLYYQNKQYSRAEEAFSSALALNENYSNARYFLGILLDRRGQKSEAIKQFEKILTFNPGNTEVQKILTNIRAGKAALNGIAPPESKTRKEAPVKENSEADKTPIKKKK